jgi:multidrug efflux pump subunit AcrB
MNLFESFFFFLLLTRKFFNENIYWHGTGKISHFLNRLLRGVLRHAPTIILMIFFCNLNIVLLLEELPQKIILYFIIEWKYANKLT